MAASEALYRLGCWETVIRALRNAAKCEQAKMMGAQSGCSGGSNDGAAGSLGEGIRRTTLTARNPSLHLVHYMKCRLEEVKRQAAACEVEGCDPDVANRRRA